MIEVDHDFNGEPVLPNITWKDANLKSREASVQRDSCRMGHARDGAWASEKKYISRWGWTSGKLNL